MATSARVWISRRSSRVIARAPPRIPTVIRVHDMLSSDQPAIATCRAQPRWASNAHPKHDQDTRTLHMLRLTVLGNLGSDAELRYTQKSNSIAHFRIAVNQVRTGANGEREETTEWFRVNVPGRQAEYASRLLKGQRVLV